MPVAFPLPKNNYDRIKAMKQNTKTLDLLYMALLVSVMAVCSWISVPSVVPFTLQTFAVFCALCLLGGKRGTIAIVVYIALGAVGLPVFSGFSGGMGAILGTTGGYIVGFLFTGLVYWLITSLLGHKLWAEAAALCAGLIVCYAFGTGWYLMVYASQTGPLGVGTALSWCVVPFILPDLAKMALALVLSRRLRPVLNRQRASGSAPLSKS